MHTPTSVDEFYGLLLAHGRKPEFIWRGEQRTYKTCQPLLGRAGKDNLEESTLRRGEPYLIAQFRRRAGQHLRDIELELTRTIWGTLVLMQHYRAPTRLLDWTYSPWVATYFASRADEQFDGRLYGFRRSAIYEVASRIPEAVLGDQSRRDYSPLIDEKSLSGWMKVIRQGDDTWLALLQPSLAPSRVAAQQACFTVSNEISLDHRAFLGQALTPADRVEIVVPSKLKHEVMLLLSSMNITAGSLFPDLGGAGESIHEVHEWRQTIPGPVDDWC